MRTPETGWLGHLGLSEYRNRYHPTVSPLHFNPTPPLCPPAQASVLGSIYDVGGTAEPGGVSLGPQTQRSGTCYTKVIPRGRM